MKRAHRKGNRGSLLLLVLVLGALLPACGTDSPTGQVTQTQAGVSTVGTPTAGLKTCTGCHTAQTEEWMLSRHANVDSNPSYTTQAMCQPCHDQLGDSAQLTPQRFVVGCESCHGGGQGHVTRGGSGPIGMTAQTTTLLGSVQGSEQFSTCTICHQLLDSSGTTTAIAFHVSNPLFADQTEVITDTHFASAGTYSSGDGGVTFGGNGHNLSNTPLGYAMDYSSSTVCTDCHDPHGNADINRDWVNGPHGNTTQTSGNDFAWSAYNWSCDGSTVVGCGNPGTGNVPRPFCQRCHTTTGYKNYANANAAGNHQLVSDMWNGLTSFLTYTPGWKPEMLECVGCHTDNRGKIRNPGAYNAIYGYRVGQPASGSSGTPVIVAYASFQYPDVSSSNVCTLCHSGRISGATIKALNTGTTPTVDFSALRTQGPHLMATAGVMFKAVGYEYDGRDYTNPSTYMHDKIGTAAVPNTGMGGPCVGCHMYRSGAAPSHLFSNVNVFVSGTTTITTVSSPVCFQCHAGSSTSLGDILTAEHTAYDAAVSALNTELAFKSLNAQNLLSRTPFYPTTDTDTTGNNTGKNNLGAAFNNSFLNTGRSLTAAYVHNSKYAKRLIYDSIDWLDDNKMNYSVGTTLNAICSNPTPSTWCTQGMPYILPNGVANGAPSERP